MPNGEAVGIYVVRVKYLEWEKQKRVYVCSPAGLLFQCGWYRGMFCQNIIPSRNITITIIFRGGFLFADLL